VLIQSGHSRVYFVESVAPHVFLITETKGIVVYVTDLWECLICI